MTPSSRELRPEKWEGDLSHLQPHASPCPVIFPFPPPPACLPWQEGCPLPVWWLGKNKEGRTSVARCSFPLDTFGCRHLSCRKKPHSCLPTHTAGKQGLPAASPIGLGAAWTAAPLYSNSPQCQGSKGVSYMGTVQLKKFPPVCALLELPR